jgi:putative membrane protein
MDTPKWRESYFSAADVERVELAVKAAESHTSGEIVPVVIPKSSYTSHTGDMAALGWVGVFGVLLLSETVMHEVWAHPVWTAVIFLLGGAICYRLGLTSWMQRLLISKGDLSQQVLRRAELEFYRENIARTEGRTGVLIFVSLLERQVVVLADRSISEKMPPETWQGVVDLIVGGIRSQSLAQGLCAGIRRAGEILSEHFPIHSDDKNELGNRLRWRDD